MTTLAMAIPGHKLFQFRVQLLLQALLKPLLPLILYLVANGFSIDTLVATTNTGLALCADQRREVVVDDKSVQAEDQH